MKSIPKKYIIAQSSLTLRLNSNLNLTLTAYIVKRLIEQERYVIRNT